jgi:hypothetical protein
MRRLPIALAIGFVVIAMGCNRSSSPTEEEKDRADQTHVGCWHIFVSKEEDGPHHEYYEIRADNSVTACFLAVNGTLIARFQGRLEGKSIVSESGELRLSLRRDGESLVIRDKKEFVFSRIERLPVGCN